MKHIKKLSGIILLTIMVSASVYAKGNGQVDFADLSSHYGEPMVEVNLTSNLMNMISSFAKSEEPEVAEILANLEYVKVRIYSLDGEADQANNTIESLSKKFKADSWETLVTVNDYEDDKNVRIFSKSTGDIIDGFVVMVVSPDDGGQAIFVNIVGSIDPNQIAMITDHLDININ